MASTKTIYKSVTLELGEQFVLPPNSVLIGAEDTASIDSSCVLPILENISCYTAVVALSAPAGNTSQPWELNNGSTGGTVKLTGFAQKASSSVAAEVLFTNPYTFGYAGMEQTSDALKAELKSKLPGVFDIQVGQYLGDRQYNLYVTVKTTEGVANSLFLTTTTNVAALVMVYTPFKQHSLYATYPDLPICTSVSI